MVIKDVHGERGLYNGKMKALDSLHGFEYYFRSSLFPGALPVYFCHAAHVCMYSIYIISLKASWKTSYM